VKSASRFLTKLWNIFKFAAGHFDEDTPDVEDAAYRDADKWIRSRATRVAANVEAEMEAYRFDAALRELREFAWNDLADDYVELAKGRLYNGRPGERDAARKALYDVVSAVARMLAPFSPHLADEMWEYLPGTEGSVHTAEWPELDAVDEAAEERGDVIAEATREIRAWKSANGYPLNADLADVELYFDPGSEVENVDTYDLSETVNAPVRVREGRPNVELVPVDVDGDDAEIGPEFRSEAGVVLGALAEADPEVIQAQKNSGDTVTLDVDGETYELDADWVDVEEEYRAAGGEEVAVVETEFGTVLVYP